MTRGSLLGWTSLTTITIALFAGLTDHPTIACIAAGVMFAVILAVLAGDR